jgi:hypothetical protein
MATARARLTGCSEPVRWMGRTMIGPKRYRVYSCEGHVEDLEALRAIRSLSYPTPRGQNSPPQLI